MKKRPEVPLYRINLAINLTQSGNGAEAARVAGALLRRGPKGRGLSYAGVIFSQKGGRTRRAPRR